MEISVIRKEERELEIEVKGDKTIVSLVRAYLLQDENVEFAAFTQDHPLKDSVRLYVRVREGDPKSALKSAIERAKADFILFQTQFSEAMK